MQLYIGNKNYSSWSMRPWLLLKQVGIAVRGGRAAPRPRTPARRSRRRCSRSRRPAACRCWSTTASRSGTAWPSPSTWPRSFPDKQLWPRDAPRAGAGAQRLRRDALRLRRAAQRLRHEHRGLAARGRRARAARERGAPGRPDAHRRDVGARRSATAAARSCSAAFTIADAYFAPVVHAHPHLRAAGRRGGRRATSNASWRCRRCGVVRSRRPAPSTTSCPRTSPTAQALTPAGAARPLRYACPCTRTSSAARCATPARPAGEGSRLGRRRRHARGACARRLPAGRQGLPGLPASRDARGIRAGPHRAQDRARLSRLRVPRRARRHAGGRPGAARPDHQRDRAGATTAR